MCPNNLKFHVPQQCSTTSDEVDLSIPRATNAKNVKDTKNPRKNKLQRPKSITTSAAKKTQVSDSLVNNKFYFSIQMSHAVSFFLCVFFFCDYFDVCSKDFLKSVLFPVAADILFFMSALFS